MKTTPDVYRRRWGQLGVTRMPLPEAVRRISKHRDRDPAEVERDLRSGSALLTHAAHYRIATP